MGFHRAAELVLRLVFRFIRVNLLRSEPRSKPSTSRNSNAGAGHTPVNRADLKASMKPDAQTKVVRDSRVPRLHVEVFEEGFLRVYWQATDYAKPSTRVIERAPVLSEDAVWEPEEPQLVTVEDVVWLFVSPADQSRFYRLRRK